MNKLYDLTPEQYRLKEQVHKMAATEIVPYLDQIDAGDMPDSVWQAFVREGFVAMCYPKEYGGTGASFLDILCMQEELAYYDIDCAMLSGASLLPLPLVMFGSDELKARILPQLASGEKRCCFALTEPEAGSDAASIRTTAIRNGDHYLVNGSKHFISFADKSDYCILLAKTDPELGSKGISAFVLDMHSEGVRVGKAAEKMGAKGAPAFEVFFHDVKIPAENLIGEEGKGFKLALTALEKNRAGVGGLGLGLARGSLDYAVKYMKERRQFGQPIAANQGLQWMISDCTMKLEAARQLVYKAACLFDQDDEQAAKFGAMAKCFATDVCMEVCITGIQVCGGVGYMHNYPQERRFRAAKLLQIVEGTNQIQRMVLGRHIFGRLK